MSAAHDAEPVTGGDVVLAVSPRPAVRPGGGPHPLRWAVAFVIPYLLVGFAWVFSNPPGAGPDEADHLVKALAAGNLQIGVKFAGPPPEDTAPAIRNASISRTVSIPAALAPDGYFCTAFNPDRTADCLPDPTYAAGMVERTATVGAYPVFWYIPLGFAALQGQTPEDAFHLARSASMVLSMLFLLLGVWHLTRWLGRAAGLGLAVALTPMSIFAAASVSTSGIEIMAAVAIAAVAVVVTRVPESLADGRTLALLAVTGVSLILSRQLGGVTLAVFGVIALARGGAPVVWEQLRRRRWPMIVTIGALVAAGVVLLIWERRYDNPELTGSLFTRVGLGDFVDRLFGYFGSGVGTFGWLDTPLPPLMMAVWYVPTVLLVFGALVAGSRADRWTLLGAFAAVVLVAYALQATVFTPIGGSLQGRHMIPLFVILPMLSGVILIENLCGPGLQGVRNRLVVGVAVAAGVLQAFSLLLNGRRYAVGLNGPVVFLADARWVPPFGWVPWMSVALVGGLLITLNYGRARSGAIAISERSSTGVER